MSYTPNYRSGDWTLICDVCGKKIKASESLHRWDGYVVCKEDWEPRHSLDFIRARADKISVPFSRPEADDAFIVICDITSRQSKAGLGTAGCMTVGFTSVIPDSTIPSGSFSI